SLPLIANVTSYPDSRSISRNISARPNSSSTIKIDCLVGAGVRLEPFFATVAHDPPTTCCHTRFAGKRIQQANPLVGDSKLAHPRVVVVIADLQNREHAQHR